MVSPSDTGTFTGSLSLVHSASNEPSPLTIYMSFTVTEGYQPMSPYILNPENNIQFIQDIADFRAQQLDDVNGGFYTFIDRQGNPDGENLKSLCGQSRIAYTFVRAFMVTGDEQYLDLARYALKFLYDHGWNNGFYFVTDLEGNYVSHWGHDDWWSLQQHYALVGIAAMVEATGGQIDWDDGAERDLDWLMRGINSNYNNLWDDNPNTKGYFDKASTDWSSRWGKGLTPTIDGITTHALLMSMMYDTSIHDQRLVELADNIVGHMVGGMDKAAAGFPEGFESDWKINYGSTNMDIGHGYKTAWCLQQAYLMNPGKSQYLIGAQAIMQDLWDAGAYDGEYGGPYTKLNWESGEITSTVKDFRMVEQGLTAGLISYYTASTQQQRDMYMTVADGSINFFMDYMMDPVYSEAYAQVNRDGSSIVNETKGGLFTAGYHSSELGYYALLYSSLYYHRSPVDLYYFFPAQDEDRAYTLTPIPTKEGLLKIIAVTLNGEPYTDFDADKRSINLPAGIGGKFKVKFGVTPAVTYTITTSFDPIPMISAVFGSSNSAEYQINTGSTNAAPPFSADQFGSGGKLRNVSNSIDMSGVTNPAPEAVYQSERYGNSTYTIPNLQALTEYTVRLHLCELYWSETGRRVFDVEINGTLVLDNFDLFAVTGAKHKAHIEEFTATANSSGEIKIEFITISDNATISGIEIIESGAAYTITASAGEGGSISPSGEVTVSEGASQTFTIAALEGYTLSSLEVDGNPVSLSDTYTFENVTEDHTISASFTSSFYIITASAGSGGSISPIGDVNVPHGDDQTFTISPEPGNKIDDVLVDGSSIGAVTTYTFSDVTADHTISAVFEVVPTYTITASAELGGSISPSGEVTVSEGASQTFTISASEGYTLSSLEVDGNPVSLSDTYTFENVTEDHTISASFTSNFYIITASAGSGGSISPIGDVNVLHGDDQSFTISPEPGKKIDDVLVDNVSVGAVSSYTFSSVTDDHTIRALFDEISSTEYKINSGNTGEAPPFSADQFASGGKFYSVSSSIDMSGLTDPAPEAVYQSERYGNITYTIPDLQASSEYTVRLHLCELYWSATGKRVFDVEINGTLVLDNFDLFAATGAKYKAHIEEFTATANGSGEIEIEFINVTDNAKIGGIEIIRSVPNSPPTVDVPAAASPNPVSGTTTELSVLGADDDGEATLTYTWATIKTPPASVSFSDNGTNSAKNSTVTFTRAGNYDFEVVIMDNGGKEVTDNVSVNVTQTATSVIVSPASVTLSISETQQFSAIVEDQFGDVFTPATVTWSATGDGDIDNDGLFTAGMVEEIATITASVGGVSGTATVTITAPNSPPTVDVPAAASPNPVSGTTTELSVLGADDDGEATLIYTWTTIKTPPASVSFSDNGTNSAKNSTATFTKPGDYDFEVVIMDNEGKEVTDNVSVTVVQTTTSITVSPASVTLSISETQQFSAVVNDQFDDEITGVTVTWSTTGDSDIDNNGLFLAGMVEEIATISASVDGVSGTATAMIVDEPNVVYQINTGSSSDYPPYSGDQYGSGGTMRSVSNSIDMSEVNGNGPAPQEVYQSERYGNSTYTIPGLDAGVSYTVRLHFAELFQTSINKRLFNVVINGTTVISNFDIYEETGARYKATIREFTATANSSGQIVIDFDTIKDNATINGIEIIQ